MTSEKYFLNFQIAFEAIMANKLRSLLTALGIIFGVAAVISMLAIGNGARQEILDQMKLVGVNNILIQPIIEQSEEAVEAVEKESDKKRFSPGLTLLDVAAMKEVLPCIEKISPEVIIETSIVKDGIRKSAKLVGVNNDYFDMGNFELQTGSLFSEPQIINGEQVCVIGKGVQTRFFSTEDPIGKFIKCGPLWFKIVGVLKERVKIEDREEGQKLGIRNSSMDVYVPLHTMLIRYKNRALVNKSKIKKSQEEASEGESLETKRRENYHQLDRLVVQVKETEDMQPAAEVIARMLERRHYGVVDYEITIPELLLKQQQRTKDIFKYVLGAIAGISLLVGGIGIMNIMLASVLERIKEIGIRQAIGATRQDIILQFLIEAVILSVSGGLFGIFLGVSLSLIVSYLFDISTLISIWSIVISFGVAAIIGLIFGITPAKRAAEQDPITSLRYE